MPACLLLLTTEEILPSPALNARRCDEHHPLLSLAHLLAFKSPVPL